MLSPTAARHPCNLPRSGKKSWHNVSNKIHQAAADHVGHEIATPQIKSGQDYARLERDSNICSASGPMAKRKNHQRNRDGPKRSETNHPQAFDGVTAVK